MSAPCRRRHCQLHHRSHRRTRCPNRVFLARIARIDRPLNPPHVLIYMLEIDDDSRLGHERLGGVRYFANETPAEDQTAGFYEIAVERLASLGIARYEISNFARVYFWNRATT